MISFLGIQGTYKNVCVGLFNDSTLLQQISIPNIQASKQLIATIDNLLTTHNITLEDLSCIVASQGPGPFSTLRTVLTTVNAIQFACATPLIGIDGLRSMAQENYDPASPHTITLLDAFNNDVYFCIPDSISTSYGNNSDLNNMYDMRYYTGYCTINMFVSYMATVQQSLRETTNTTLFPIRFIGNGSLLHKHTIETQIPASYVHNPIDSACSLFYLGEMGLQAWKNKRTVKQLLPLYLKKHHAER